MLSSFYTHTFSCRSVLSTFTNYNVELQVPTILYFNTLNTKFTEPTATPRTTCINEKIVASHYTD
jgi:hypothetical protein